MSELLSIAFGARTVTEPFLQPDVTGVFFPSQVSVRTQDPPRFSQEMSQHLSQHWQDEGMPPSGERRTWTFTEPPAERDGTLLLSVAPGSFRDVNATRDTEVRKRFPEQVRKIDPVAATIVPVTSDGLLVVGTKGEGPVSIIGGYPEVPEDTTRNAKPQDLHEGVWSPVLTAVRETWEETGIQPDELHEIYASGVVHVGHREANVSVVTHAARTSLAGAEIVGRPKCDELDVAFLPDSEDVITDLLLRYYATLKSSKAALLLRGRVSYGEDWYHAMSSQLTSLWQYCVSLSLEERAAAMTEDRRYLHSELLVQV